MFHRPLGMIALLYILALPVGAQQSADGLQKLVPPVPTPASFVADPAKVLSAEAHASIDEQIRTLQASGMGDVGVAILPSIGDYEPMQVGLAIYRTWRIGSVAEIGNAHRDVGVLLLIVPKELAPDKKGHCWISTGTGAEGIITDAVSGMICEDAVVPLLKVKDYAGAVAAGIVAIGARLRADEGLADDSLVSAPMGIAATPVDDGNDFHWWYIPGGLAGLGGGLVGARRWRRNRPRKCPKCGLMMQRLDEAADNAFLAPGQLIEEEIKSIDYDVWQCQCGEHLLVPWKAWFTKYSICRQCKNRTAWSTRRVISPATTMSSGSAEDTYRCKACPATWVKHVVLPRIQQSSSSSSSSGGGGGGSSFGGSGSSGGGGGGRSY